MAVLLSKSVSYIFNSDPVSGSQNLSADGSTFQVSLNDPIRIPAGAVDCKAGVIQAAIWNTAYNISAGFNNNKFKFTTSVAPAGTYTITIADGLYSVALLQTFIATSLVNLGLPSGLFTISGDTATQKSVVTILTSGDSVDFTVANSVRQVLGFNSVVITAPSANYSFYSNNTAAFNRVNSWIIASNLVSQGIPVNSQSQGIIASVPITAPPGSQVTYSPQNVIWFDGRELIGQPKINMLFQLLDQDLRTITTPDYWSFVLTISYDVLISSGTLALKP
jgi:hypothetical protein